MTSDVELSDFSKLLIPAPSIPAWFAHSAFGIEDWELAVGYEHLGGKLYHHKPHFWVLTNGGTWRFYIIREKPHPDLRVEIELVFGLLVEKFKVQLGGT